MLDSLAYGAGDLIVGPVGAAGLWIGSQVGRHDRTGQSRHRQHLPGKLFPGDTRPTMLSPILGRMTDFAVQYSLNQILSAGNALGRSLKLHVGGGAFFRAKKRTPSDGKSDGDWNDHDDADEQNFPELFHEPFQQIVLERPQTAFARLTKL